eukprot:TRINITY_DN5381_c0_g2_i3.p2 TRINITY_DN5381_c0_g2~~TRINITY_DN5381_c0_g2_i3.p2  ORF type:complete len:142 (+),score=21.96 TRINITY_DN5381_c0_g2_i3:79-504(+)
MALCSSRGNTPLMLAEQMCAHTVVGSEARRVLDRLAPGHGLALYPDPLGTLAASGGVLDQDEQVELAYALLQLALEPWNEESHQLFPRSFREVARQVCLFPTAGPRGLPQHVWEKVLGMLPRDCFGLPRAAKSSSSQCVLC